MTLMDEQYAVRARLLEDLRKDLVGPQAPDEVLTDPPLAVYLVGVLHATDDALGDEVRVGEVEDEAEVGSAPEQPVALSAVRRPASMGLTFAVDARCSSVTVLPRAAAYEPIGVDVTDRAALMRAEWERREIPFEPVDIDVTIEGARWWSLGGGLHLHIVVRAPSSEGRSITVSLVNRSGAKQALRDLGARFQCGFDVRSSEGAIFVERPGDASTGVADEDLASYRLLYRHARSFAVGHGCASSWSGEHEDRKEAVATSSVPAESVPVVESNPAIHAEVLSFQRCAELPAAELIGELESFVSDYVSWAEGLTAAIPDLPTEMTDVAERHAKACREAARRMSEGVSLLHGPEELSAFRLMNEAMLEQRARTVWLAGDRTGDGPRRDASLAWRPFQLAFILVTLKGVADPSHPDRALADLLWFPTGGGKTEAYLGLIAFVACLRRHRTGHAGVSVLMRYTLRLLTIQQFERAALLMCCLEALRQDRADLGDEPFAIGLWVGRAGTPNSRKEAIKAIKRMKDGLKPREGSLRQLDRCSWCGRSLASDSFRQSATGDRIVISCNNPKCRFRDGLPVLIVDEDLYDHRPTLIIGTADKFASLPWQERCRDLFNVGHEESAPELVIQDELHLISGPLGTLAGLYETAVDLICESQGGRPKVIASSATIRRATKQVKSLFDRGMAQFPPPGIDARDSYFAVEAPPERRADRLYVGCLAPSASQATSMIRTYARLMQSAGTSERPPEAVDPYWTLVGYFNSLRVLGGARMQVQDDVEDRLNLLAASGTKRSVSSDVIELTSRVDAEQIPAYLGKLARPHTAVDSADVVLATNMISVGVDVERLGLMVVMGQPQATSEYIQSTSRVGRRHPGMVVVVYNAARSRDLSHYESFAGYHRALYRQVESTSVTPFSARARDRALHAVLIALARLTVPALTGSKSAAAVTSHENEVRRLIGSIVDRVGRIQPEEAERTKQELDEILAQWLSRAKEDVDLTYSDRKAGQPLLVEFGEDLEGSFGTLRSLRDVDAESRLQVVG